MNIAISGLLCKGKYVSILVTYPSVNMAFSVRPVRQVAMASMNVVSPNEA